MNAGAMNQRNPESTESKSGARIWPWIGVGLALLAGCVSGTKFPGKQVIGTYDFEAIQSGGNCHFADQPDGGFGFKGTLSYDPGSSTAYFTVHDPTGTEVTRPAQLDGGILISEGTAPRSFTECNCAQNVTVDETLTVALLSGSQAAALDGGCPPSSLDGGVPAPNADAGITGPGMTASGFDAPLVCGTQVDQVQPGSGCTCDACALRYAVTGSRE